MLANITEIRIIKSQNPGNPSKRYTASVNAMCKIMMNEHSLAHHAIIPLSSSAVCIGHQVQIGLPTQEGNVLSTTQLGETLLSVTLSTLAHACTFPFLYLHLFYPLHTAKH